MNVCVRCDVSRGYVGVIDRICWLRMITIIGIIICDILVGHLHIVIVIVVCIMDSILLAWMPIISKTSNGSLQAL
jgi:hypothetical protein